MATIPERNAAPGGEAQARPKVPTQDYIVRDEALLCISRGWHIFPVHSVVGGACTCRKGLTCSDKGKHPRSPHGFKDAIDDRAQVEQWFRCFANANYGIAMGSSSGFFVLDVDPRSGGERSLEVLESEYGLLPHTVEVLTGGGGRHLYFRHPGWRVRNSQGTIGRGLDVKGDGGYVVGPGSIHESGKRYEWELSSHPDSTPLAEAPEWFLKLIAERSEPGAERTEGVTNCDRENGDNGEDRDNRDNRSNIASVRSARSVLSVTQAIELSLPKHVGERNRKIMQFARMLKGMPDFADAPKKELRPLVREWHRRALPVIGTKPFEDTWADFCTALSRVRFPIGEGALADALKRVDDAPPISIALELYESRDTQRLVALCAELQRIAGDEPFFFSCRKVAELFGLDRMTAWRRLKALCEDEVLLIIKLGTQNRATRYRYIADSTYGKNS